MNPRMMLKLLLYSYSIGVTSSREMERRCATDVAFRFLSANAAPDYRSIRALSPPPPQGSRRAVHPGARIVRNSRLLKLGRVALDGTKLRASASRHKAMSYDHMKKKIEQLDAEVREILAEAEAVDREEDEAFGADRRGDEVPAELARRGDAHREDA